MSARQVPRDKIVIYVIVTLATDGALWSLSQREAAAIVQLQLGRHLF